jgi:hypothetical protein
MKISIPVFQLSVDQRCSSIVIGSNPVQQFYGVEIFLRMVEIHNFLVTVNVFYPEII